MNAAIANIFGYVLNFIYGIVQNYGLSVIIFSVFLKLLMLPITIKQIRSQSKSAKIQEEVKKLQVRYSSDQEKLNAETFALYKREKYSPWSGCLVTILQFIIFISIFYLVSRPLTYMKKVDSEVINNYVTQIQENGENVNYPEIKIIQKFGAEDERVNLNMNFLGLDLTDVPLQTINANLKTPDGGSINFVKIITVMIIPVTYIILLFVTTKINNKKMMEMNSKNSTNTEVKSEEKIKNDEEKNEIIDDEKLKNKNLNNKKKNINNKNNNSQNKNKSKNKTTAKIEDKSDTKDDKKEENNKNKLKNKNNSGKNSSKNKNNSSQKNKEINFSKKQNKLKVKIENENNAEEKNVKIEKFEDENKEVEIKTTEIIDDVTKRADEKSDADVNQEEMMKMTNTMTWMMPLLSVSIALVAPLGLSLYWLSNLLFQLIERAIIDKISEKNKKEAEE